MMSWEFFRGNANPRFPGKIRVRPEKRGDTPYLLGPLDGFNNPLGCADIPPGPRELDDRGCSGMMSSCQ